MYCMYNMQYMYIKYITAVNLINPKQMQREKRGFYQLSVNNFKGSTALFNLIHHQIFPFF